MTQTKSAKGLLRQAWIRIAKALAIYNRMNCKKSLDSAYVYL